MPLNWTLSTLDSLRPIQLYELLSLRNAVFVVEQNCVYQDADGYDLTPLTICSALRAIAATPRSSPARELSPRESNTQKLR